MSLEEIKEQKIKAEEARKKAEQDLEAVKTERAAAEEGTLFALKHLRS